jgi:hypothetical protein
LPSADPRKIGRPILHFPETMGNRMHKKSWPGFVRCIAYWE